MTQDEANRIKELVDSMVTEKPTADTVEPMEPVAENAAIPVDKPKDKRVVRTKSSGDRVYLLDEKTQEKRWISDEKVLEGLGFSFADVVEIEDSELAKYKLTQAVYSHNVAEAK